LRGCAKEAERALEAACLARFGTLRPVAPNWVLRSDNGLIERFFRSFKEECVWQYQFETFEEVQQKIHTWMRWYNEDRPHQALKYRSPRQYAWKQDSLVA
jgi:putative transposase